jgi:hypothetical protein
MARILFGSSNVYRNFPRALTRGSIGDDIQLVECTKKTVFDAHLTLMGTLAPGSLIVTSVLENFISDACHGLDEEEVVLFANQQITAHVEVLTNLLTGSAGSRVVIVPPFSRQLPGEVQIWVLPKKEKTFLFYRKKKRQFLFNLLICCICFNAEF